MRKSMLPDLRRLVRRVRLRARLKDRFWAEAYFREACWPHHASVDRLTGCLLLEDSGLSLGRAETALLPSQTFAHDLAAQGAQFGRNETGEITVNINGLSFLVQIRQDISFLHDVFVDRSYGIHLPPSPKKRIVWDIGMNVGFASLFFARDEGFEAVFGYEPFPETYRQARKHLEMNPTFSQKITAVNKGVGDRDETLTAGYDKDSRGSLSAFGGTAQGTPGGRGEAVEIESAPRALRHILAQYPGREIIVKMDCEGGEHRILPALHEAGLLPALKALMIEWHGEGTGRLEEILTQNNFVLFTSRSGDGSLGYIFAVQSGCEGENK